MDTGIKQTNDGIVNESVEWVVPRRTDMLLLAWFATIAAPWISFLIVGQNKFGDAEWQNGQLSTYFDLSFAASVWILFIPFLIYSSLCVALLLWRPNRFAPFWFVRFGIYTGTLLAVQFTVQLAFAGDLAAGILIGFIAIIPLLLIILGVKSAFLYIRKMIKLNRAHDNFWPWAIGLGLLGAITVGLVLFFGGAGVLFLVFMTGGVALCPIFGGLFSYNLFVQFEKKSIMNTSVKVASWLGWGAGYSAAGYVAINRVFDLYTQLPDEPPNCYIATASAKGHSGLTGAIHSQTSAGSPLAITRQLQILKGGELLLRLNWPQLHRLMRVGYDFFGPKVAHRMGSPWSADIGYIFFKPFEWVTFFMIKWRHPNQIEKLNRFYLGRAD